MDQLIASAGFWAFLGILVGPILLGIGWLVKRVSTRKDEGIAKYGAEIQRARDEADRKDLRLMERTEEVMQLRAEKFYQAKLLQNCEEELARLRLSQRSEGRAE